MDTAETLEWYGAIYDEAGGPPNPHQPAGYQFPGDELEERFCPSGYSRSYLEEQQRLRLEEYRRERREHQANLKRVREGLPCRCKACLRIYMPWTDTREVVRMHGSADD